MKKEDPKAGDIIDRRFLLKREIARGGMGAVFEAEQQITGRVVAIKLLHKRAARLKGAAERLLREARAITAARHSGIVELLDAGVCPSTGPYIVMEILMGRPLDGILASRGTLPVADAVHVARQMCDALAFVHDHGIVHRDLKPSNVFITRDQSHAETVKLFDFGIAVLSDPRAQKLTANTEMLGTPEYMSPEQLFGEPGIDHRCDLYAVAVTLFECLTGAVPHEGNYVRILGALDSQTTPPSARALRNEVTAELDQVLAWGLARSRDERFPSAAAFRDALLQATGLENGRTELLGPPGLTMQPPAQFPPGTSPPEVTMPPTAIPPSSQRMVADDVRGNTRPLPIVMRRVPSDAPNPRRHERAPFMTHVRLVRHDGSVVTGRSEDISIGGMLVIATEPVADGEVVWAQFSLPGAGGPVTVEAVCRWIRAGRTTRGAVGLEFSNLSAQAVDIITNEILPR